MSTDSKPVTGCRHWEMVSIVAECPYCHTRNEIDAYELLDEEMWSELPWEHECDICQRYFWIEVTDDDRA